MIFPQTRHECLNKSREFKILLWGYETYKKFCGDSETNLLTNGDISKEWCKLTQPPCPFLRDSARFVTIIIHCPESGAEWDVRVHVCREVQMPPRYEQTGYNMLGWIPRSAHRRQQFITAWLPYACETTGSNLVQIQPVIHVRPDFTPLCAVYSNNGRCFQSVTQNVFKSR